MATNTSEAGRSGCYLKCPNCGGPLRIIAALTDPDSVRTYLDGVGLDSRPPPIAPARLVPAPAFDFAA